MIATDLGIRKDAVEIYEKLYFNTRNVDGTLLRGCYNRSRMAMDANEPMNEETEMESVWRYIGFTFGYDALVQVWHWERDAVGIVGSPKGLFDEMWRYAQAYLLDKLVRNQVRAFDLNNMMGNYIQDQRMKFDTKQETGDALAGAQIAIGMLQMCAPHVHEAAKTVDGESMQEKTEQIAARLTQQRQIAGEKLSTSQGAGAAAIDDMLRESADLVKLKK